MADLQNDIGRYLRGEMSPKEMHRIEKEALSNPFLAEALEGGLLNAENFDKDVAELQTQIGKKTDKQVWFSPLRIAASVIVLAVAGWMVYWSVASPETITPLAQKQAEAPASPPTSASADSSLKAVEDPKPDLLSLNAKPAKEEEKKERKTIRPMAEMEAEPAGAVSSSSKDEEPLKEIVAPPIEVAAEKEVHRADTISIATNDDVAPELAKKSSVAATERRTKLKAEDSKSGPAASAPAAPKASSRSDTGEARTKSSEPSDGIERYLEYLKTSLRYPAEAVKNKTQGIVEVEFTVTSDGNVKDFKVLKSIGDGCDEELIRLIKAGPKWNPKTENSRNVDSQAQMAFKFTL